jgi:hypothetical protein
VQEPLDIVEAVERPTIHIRRIHLSTRRQGVRQSNGLIAEMSEPTSGMSQAQASQTKQRASGHSPRPDLHAPVLDELPVVVVQGTPDQSVRRLRLMRPVSDRQLQRLGHHPMRQGRRVLEAQV